MFVKIHKSYRDIVAICDENLLGKFFEEGKFQLEIKENFFEGEKTSSEELLKIMENYRKEDATFNIIGDKSTDLALKAGIINKEGIKKIQGIPFALILM
jgi:hypothetical protein